MSRLSFYIGAFCCCHPLQRSAQWEKRTRGNNVFGTLVEKKPKEETKKKKKKPGLRLSVGFSWMLDVDLSECEFIVS